jgi:hypothetical protein
LILPQSVTVALETAWLPVLGLALAGWALLMRLRWDHDRFSMSIGPWRRSVTLSELESVTWKRTGGARSRGTIFLRDRAGRTVPIYVSRFTGRSDWGPLIVRAAERSKASVDRRSRAYLEGRVPDTIILG